MAGSIGPITDAAGIPGQYVLEIVQNSGAYLAGWFREKLGDPALQGRPDPALAEAAAAVRPGCGGLVTLPYWNAVQSPFWNPIAHGAIVGLAGSYGYRREISRQRPLLRQLAPASFLGGLTGALLLLTLPSEVFDAVVPALVALGLLLVVFGPRLQRAAARHHPDDPASAHRVLTPVATFAAGVYGGYFGAGQGIILVGLLSVLVPIALQELNGAKNLLVSLVNAVAAVVFVALRADAIDWTVVLLIGIGSFAGGLIGSSVGRRLPTPVLRAVIVVVGSVALWQLLRR